MIDQDIEKIIDKINEIPNISWLFTPKEITIIIEKLKRKNQ